MFIPTKKKKKYIIEDRQTATNNQTKFFMFFGIYTEWEIKELLARPAGRNVYLFMSVKKYKAIFSYWDI